MPGLHTYCMYHRARDIMRGERGRHVKKPDPFTMESFGDIFTGGFPAAARVFDIITDLLSSN